MAPKKACGRPASRRPLSLSPAAARRVPAGSHPFRARRALPGCRPPASSTGTLTVSQMLPAVLPSRARDRSRRVPSRRAAGCRNRGEQRIDERRGRPRFVNRLRPGDVDHLDDARVRAGTCAGAAAPAPRRWSTSWHGSRAAAPLLVGDGFAPARARSGGTSPSAAARHARDARDLVFRNRAGAARHRRTRGPMADAPAAIASRASSRSRDAADLHEHVTRLRPRLRPGVRFSAKSRLLRPHDAETLARSAPP